MNLIDQRTERVKVTMEWEVDALIGDTQGNGIRCTSWLADAEAVVAACTQDNLKVLNIAWIGGGE